MIKNRRFRYIRPTRLDHPDADTLVTTRARIDVVEARLRDIGYQLQYAPTRARHLFLKQKRNAEEELKTLKDHERDVLVSLERHANSLGRTITPASVKKPSPGCTE